MNIVGESSKTALIQAAENGTHTHTVTLDRVNINLHRIYMGGNSFILNPIRSTYNTNFS